jgi:hypothetical protein
MARIIRRHPSVIYAGGNHFFWAGRDEMQNLRGLDLPPSLRLSPNGEEPEAVKTDLGRLATFLYASDELLPFFQIRGEDVIPADVYQLRKLVSRLTSTYGAFVSKPRFIDKSQSFSVKVPLLRAAFPDAKFVLISRNPYALIASRSTGAHLEWANSVAKREIRSSELLQLRAEHWRNSFEVALNDLRDSAYCQMQFESFLADPAEKLTEVLDFLELENSGDLLPAPHHKLPRGSVSGEKWYPMASDPNTRALNEISKESIKNIKIVVGDTAERLGYDSPA